MKFKRTDFSGELRHQRIMIMVYMVLAAGLVIGTYLI